MARDSSSKNAVAMLEISFPLIRKGSNLLLMWVIKGVYKEYYNKQTHYVYYQPPLEYKLDHFQEPKLPRILVAFRWRCGGGYQRPLCCLFMFSSSYWHTECESPLKGLAVPQRTDRDRLNGDGTAFVS